MRMIFVALLATALPACSSNTQFKGQQNNEFQIDDSIDKTPTTVNNANGTTTTVEVETPETLPAGTWIPSKDDFVLRDRETGTLWNLRGEAFEGPLAGLQLEQVPAFNSFWFAWSVFYDGSAVWNRTETNQTAPLAVDDGSCLVPCDEVRQACGGGKDCIPALDYDGVDNRPVAKMVAAKEESYLSDGDFVLGVVVNGQAHAYPHNIFWWHEIYNDEIDGTEFSVTFCPLTGSGIVFAGTLEGSAVDFGVSGNLYNSNLVMFDRQTDTLWSQMFLTGISGPGMGKRLTVLPVVETTWQRWKEMWPNTLVASDDQGYSRDYSAYPYGDYRTDDTNTFRPTNPPPSLLYDAKDRVLGLPSATTPTVFVMNELESYGDRVVVNDEYEERPVVVAFERQHRMAIPFFSEVDGQVLTFEGTTAP